MKTTLGTFGCCLACRECGKCHGPCYNCICSKCDWYTKSLYSVHGEKVFSQHCFYLSFKREIVLFDYLKVLNSSDKAYLLSDGDIQVWIPSQFIRFKNGDIGITQWIADEKGLFGEEGIFELDGQHFKEFEEKHIPKIKYWCREASYGR